MDHVETGEMVPLNTSRHTIWKARLNFKLSSQKKKNNAHKERLSLSLVSNPRSGTEQDSSDVLVAPYVQ